MARRTPTQKRTLTTTSVSHMSRLAARRRTRLNLAPAQQQALLGLALLGIALLVLVSLTLLHKQEPVGRLGTLALSLLGWSAYPSCLLLALLGGAYLAEAASDRARVSWPRVMGLLIVWLAALAESALIFVAGTASGGGSLGSWLVYALPSGWPPIAQHGFVLLVLAAGLALTLRMCPEHLWRGLRALCGVISQRYLFGTKDLPSTHWAPSPYLGQRPMYSRYGRAQADAAALPARQAQQPARQARRSLRVEPCGDAGHDAFDFEAGVASREDDSLNDLHLHRQQIGLLAQGSARRTQPIARRAGALSAVSQPALPLAQVRAGLAKDATNEGPTAREPLSPHPGLLAQPNKAHAATAVPAPGFPWQLPALTLLTEPEEGKLQRGGEEVWRLASTIEQTLRSLHVAAEVRPEDVSLGPTIMRFGIRPTGKPAMKKDEHTGQVVPVRDERGEIVYDVRTRVSRILAVQNDLALALSARQMRMQAPVPGRPYVGVEIPHQQSHLVTLREVLQSQEYQAAKATSKLTVALGKDVAGQVRMADLARMPHVLIAGASGSGKSMLLHALIASLLTQATPDDVRLLMVDPKRVELSRYNGIPHLLCPVVTNVEQVVSRLKNALSEMERRYRLFSGLGVRHLSGYRKLRLQRMESGDASLTTMAAIVIIIDELADLVREAPQEGEELICRLAQLGRAAGMHLVLATQRPSVEVITGRLKANIPTRIALLVSSAVDSRTILDRGGAERLLGGGDMLYLPADADRPERIQGAFVAEEEASQLANCWREQAELIMPSAGLQHTR